MQFGDNNFCPIVKSLPISHAFEMMTLTLTLYIGLFFCTNESYGYVLAFGSRYICIWGLYKTT